MAGVTLREAASEHDRDDDALDALALLASAAQKVWERSDKLTLHDVCERLGVDPEWVEYQEARRTGRTSRALNLDAIADLTARTGGYEDGF